MKGIEILQVGVEETDAGVAIVHVSGELDSYSAPQMADEVDRVLRCRVTKIVLDLSQVSFIDASGLTGLIDVSRKVKGRGVGFAVRRPSEIIMRMKQLLNVDGAQLPLEAEPLSA